MTRLFFLSLLLAFLPGCRSAQPPVAIPVPAGWVSESDFSAWVASLPEGGTVTVPQPIKLKNARRYSYDFRNCELVWGGQPDETMFTFSRLDGCEFRNLRITASVPGVSAFDITSHPPDADGYTPTALRFTDVEIDGPGLQFGWRIDASLGGGPDANNDEHEWTRCTVQGVKDTMWAFAGTQSLLHRLDKCGGNGQYVTKHFLTHAHTCSVTVTGGGGGNLTDYALVLGQRGYGPGKLEGQMWENCTGGLLAFSGNAVTGYYFPIIRCSHDQLGGDGKPVIDYGLGVPVAELTGNSFSVRPNSAGKWWPVQIVVNCQPSTNSNRQVAGSFRMIGNSFSHPANIAPTITASQWLAETQAFGNQFWSSGLLRGMVRIPPPRR